MEFGKPVLLQAQELGWALLYLAAEQAEWSQKTFGPDDVKGPLGALKHLEKETREAQLAWDQYKNATVDNELVASVDFNMELADCLILLLDANRRSGSRPLDLIRAAQTKMKVNKARQWPAYDPSRGDVPVEHVKGAELPHPKEG